MPEESKSRSGRFDQPANELVEKFNATITFEQRVCPYDIEDSKAHATMLARQGIISEADAKAICRGLDQVAEEIREGKFVFSVKDEDIHMAIEKRMTEIVGPAGGRLHTGRSRNDQTTTSTKMYLRHEVRESQKAILRLQKVIVSVAEKNRGVIMPGYTHMQTGQPILFAHWIMAYFWMLQRDFTRLHDLHERMNFCPLGAAALAGTDFPIDRSYTAKALGFAAPTENSIDSVSDRDHMVEFNAAAAMCYMHLSRLAEELVMFSTQDFKFIELSDDFCTGSSIMPQKKNPDVTELIRGKTGRVYGDLNTLLVMMKGLPLAYNKDMQEDKEAIFDAVDTLELCLKTITPMLDTMKTLPANMRRAAAKGFINATDCADYLTKKGMPFRDAYKLTGCMVSDCIAADKTLEELTLTQFQTYSPLFGADIYDAIDLVHCCEGRTSYGGPSAASVEKQIALATARLDAWEEENA